MKKHLLILAFQMLLVSVISAQLKAPEIISPGGGTSYTSNLSVEWTLGELAVQTTRTGKLLMTEGFHQPILAVDRIGSVQAEQTGMPGTVNTTSSVELEVFPNPFHTFIQVRFDMPTASLIELTMMSMEGKRVTEMEVLPGTTSTSLDMQHYPPGIYLLHFRSAEGHYSETFRISKI